MQQVEYLCQCRNCYGRDPREFIVHAGGGGGGGDTLIVCPWTM